MAIITDAIRWKAVLTGEESYHVIDILVDLPGGGHVASMIGFEVYGQVCAATCTHATLIAAAPLLLHMLQQARAARPDAWFAVRSGVRRELPSAPEPPHGIASASRPSATPSPRFAALCDARRVYPCPARALRPSKSPPPCCKGSRTPSVTRPNTNRPM